MEELTKTYDIIYMDPPWEYHFGGPMSSGSSIDKHYSTMTDKELMDLKVSELANRDCLLYMWTTSTHMKKAIALGEHWGFEYKVVAFVWDKVRPVTGYYTMGQAEFVLCFKRRRGNIPKPRGTRGCRQILVESKREHSRKPDEIRDRITSMHPTQTKLEMFARTSPEGWDVWGNETDKF
jgi:N6-adenosine-specific RNA methylase IME4